MTKHGMIPEAAVAMGYSRMAFIASSLAQFLRDLGYNAIPMGNETGLSVPMAIDAGLGEFSRAGWLVTPKYRPRVRLAKVITDLPLVPDQPISFGVPEFCEICGKCANCQQYWADSGVSCSFCVGVCPFNKPQGWLHDATRVLIGAKSGSIDNILLKLDDASGYGKKLTPGEFWQRDNYVHVKS